MSHKLCSLKAQGIVGNISPKSIHKCFEKKKKKVLISVYYNMLALHLVALMVYYQSFFFFFFFVIKPSLIDLFKSTPQ